MLCEQWGEVQLNLWSTHFAFRPRKITAGMAFLLDYLTQATSQGEEFMHQFSATAASQSLPISNTTEWRPIATVASRRERVTDIRC
jgi:hypothetical protein